MKMSLTMNNDVAIYPNDVLDVSWIQNDVSVALPPSFPMCLRDKQQM